MKTIHFLKATLPAFFLFIAASAFSQGKFDKWPELKAYHSVMSATFHPSETGDLAPVKKRAQELADKARALAEAKIPDEFNKKEVQEAVKKLAADSKALAKLVSSKAADEKIKSDLALLHDTFHLIVEKCSGEEHHHGHDHGHEGHTH
jgi:hypothetical protein